MLIVWCVCLRLRRKHTHQKGTWGSAHRRERNGVFPSTGVTCGGLCLRTAKNTRKSVPQLCSGVYGVFDFVENTIHPTRMGSVREPGSLTHPQVTPIEGFSPGKALTPAPLGGEHPAASSACKRVGNARRCVPTHSGGVYVFSTLSKKT
jgi:hypothetical protein